MSQTAVTNLVALLVTLRIQCQLRRSETINYATTADAARLKREFERRKKAGFDGDWLSAGDLRRRIAIAGFAPPEAPTSIPTARHSACCTRQSRRMRAPSSNRECAASAVSVMGFGSRLHEDSSTRAARLSRLCAPANGATVSSLVPCTRPYIGPHRRYPGHWFALGYGENGMTFAYLAARLLLERWRGVRSADHALFQFDRHG